MGLAFTLLIMSEISSLCLNHCFQRSLCTGVLLRGGLITAIYTKSLRFTGRSRAKIPSGKLVNHISTGKHSSSTAAVPTLISDSHSSTPDVSRIDFSCGFFHFSWTAPIQVSGSTFLDLFLKSDVRYLETVDHLLDLTIAQPRGVLIGRLCVLDLRIPAAKLRHEEAHPHAQEKHGVDGQARKASAGTSPQHARAEVLRLGGKHLPSTESDYCYPDHLHASDSILEAHRRISFQGAQVYSEFVDATFIVERDRSIAPCLQCYRLFHRLCFAWGELSFRS